MKKITKGWGHELIFASEPEYCGKFMVFNKGSKFSMHFHSVKDESWYIQSGEFEVHWIDTKIAKIHVEKLTVGDTWRNPPLLPHQVHCVEEGTIIEVSTFDNPDDNHRVLPGDNQ